MKTIPIENRYGENYSFQQVNENTWTLVGNFKYYRTGGFAGESLIRNNDIGFFDPSGGPFISKGFLIDARKVSRIYTEDNNFFFELE